MKVGLVAAQQENVASYCASHLQNSPSSLLTLLDSGLRTPALQTRFFNPLVNVVGETSLSAESGVHWGACFYADKPGTWREAGASPG